MIKISDIGALGRVIYSTSEQPPIGTIIVVGTTIGTGVLVTRILLFNVIVYEEIVSSVLTAE